MRSNSDLIKELRTDPGPWMDTAIVVAFENRFEFVPEDDPDPLTRLNSLQQDGGLAIGLAGMTPTSISDQTFSSRVFQEYEGQGWAHRYMDLLKKIVSAHSGPGTR